jgi:hypothetical protein
VSREVVVTNNSVEPYLSVVATARNDEHGGNLLGRMGVFVRAWVEQCKRFGLRFELILVEWNPPTDRAPLREALPWPSEKGPCDIRVVTVPAAIHDRFEHASKLPLFQMIAKNVGLRRARGKFALATNIDLLFSDELMRSLAAKTLREDRMYRADRHDVEAEIPPEIPIEAQLRWCGVHLLRVNSWLGTRNVRTGELHRNYWPRTWRVELLEALQDLGLIPAVTRKRLHLNACGDFTLLSMPMWRKLQGYPEWPIFSMHLDSLLCTAAHFGGATQVVLPGEVFHIEHATGSGWTPEGQRTLEARIAAKGLPMLSDLQFNQRCIAMRHKGEPERWNDPNWGLAQERLDEWSPF